MKNAIQKGLLLTMASVLLLSVLLCSVAASQTEETKPQTLLALGDSLTTGYGLANYTPGGSPYLCNSYINQIAKAMGLEGGQTYINRAVNGDRSADLAKLLPSLENEVKSADMIIITIGGNDLLSLLPSIASLIAGTAVTDTVQAIQIIAGTTSDTYVALASNPEFQELISTLITNLESNLKTIAGFIQEKAPNARVIFLKQFNPLNNIPGFTAAGDFAGTLLASINSTLETTCLAYGYEVVDIPSVIDENAINLTNILGLDIHPNDQGHTEMAKLLAKHLGLSLGLPGENEETQEPEETTELVEETTLSPEETTLAAEVTDEVTTSTPETTIEESSETIGTSDSYEVTEPVTPAKGCSAVADCAAILLTSVCAAYVVKKRKH